VHGVKGMAGVSTFFGEWQRLRGVFGVCRDMDGARDKIDGEGGGKEVAPGLDPSSKVYNCSSHILSVDQVMGGEK
jgi:hypothetical protein